MHNALLALAYLLFGKLGLSLAFVHASASAVWPPTGIALAATLAWGIRLWPGIFLGAFLVNLTTHQAEVGALSLTYVATCLGIAAGNTLEALIGARLVVRWAGGSSAFDQPGHVFLFTLIAGGLAPIASAVCGVTSLCLGGAASWNDSGAIALTWWLGDSVSALTVAPPLLLWHTQLWSGWSFDKISKMVILVAVLFGLGQIAFGWSGLPGAGFPVSFAFMPILVWAAYSLGQRETAAATLLLAALALAGTLQGHGPFAVNSTTGITRTHDAVLYLDFFVGVTSVTALSLGAVVVQRHRIQNALRAAHDHLEGRVQERTAILAQTNENLRQEIGERLHAERALRDSQRRIRAVIETAFNAFIGMDTEGLITQWNAQAEDTFGWPRQQALGRSVADLIIPPALREAHREGLRRYLASGEARVLNRRLEFTALHRLGHEFPVEISVWRAPGEDPMRFYAFVNDISARRESEAKLRQNERLAAIGEMLTALAHESRNALQRSQACLEILALKVTADAATTKLLDDIQEAQDHLHQLFERVRGFAAPVVLKRERADLGLLLDETWRQLEIMRQGRQATLENRRTELSLDCNADRLALGQVFRNVLENSLGACTDPVVIRAEWRELEKDGRVLLQLSLGDNGPGLSPEARQRIFEPFFTTKTQGTGLGMAIARRIVEAHGGRMDLTAGTGVGAEIMITLPRQP